MEKIEWKSPNGKDLITIMCPNLIISVDQFIVLMSIIIVLEALVTSVT